MKGYAKGCLRFNSYRPHSQRLSGVRTASIPNIGIEISQDVSCGTKKGLTYSRTAFATMLKGEPMDKVVKKMIKDNDYKGCQNCVNQIVPLRMCEWGERGGDGKLHFMCPKWERRK